MCDTARQLGRELAVVFEPLEELFDPANADAMLAELGLRPPPGLSAATALTDALGQAARDANAYVVVGVCEKIPNTLGTMFNTQC